MKKTPAIIAALAIAAFMLSPQKSQAAPSGTGKPIELVYWYSWTDKIQENNVNLTKMFNESRGKELNIHVTAEYQGTYDDLHQKLQAAHIAGDPPSVSVMEIASTRRFAQNGVIVPLTSYIKRDNVDMDDFFKGLLPNCNVDGEWYGLPYLRSTPIMYMNTTLLAKAGLDPKGPETWADLAEYCRAIKEKTGAYGLSMYSYIWVLEAFMLSNGSSTLTADEMKSNIDTPASREVFAFFRDLVDGNYIRCVAGSDSKKIDADYMNQKTAMWFTSTANLTQILSVAEENGFEVNTCFIPANKTHGVPTGGCNLVMATLQSDEEKEAAWQFIKWMTETPQAAYAHAYTGYVPSRKSAAATPEIQALYEKKPQFRVALDQLELYSSGRPMNPGYTQVSEEYVAVMDAIWVNGADIDSTLAAAGEKIVRMKLLDAR
ncbi:MAG: ABC transporter substrate-binding protein [Synergistaceae bacterium]|jgi:sn-glycerol 3-phosphate transport system substrate-binding protein|nr:ABC transporter substrate-binding protein [Synergistaceae bacterium]